MWKATGSYCGNLSFRRSWLFLSLGAFGGDFNPVLNPSERKRSECNMSSVRNFNSFMLQAKVIDLPLHGISYTWTNSREMASWARLDRFMLSPTILVQTGLPRSVSGHNAIMIEEPIVDWGPSPFDFYNNWLEEEDLMKSVVRGWKGCKVNGSNGKSQFAKLKASKSFMKKWLSSNSISLESPFSKEEVWDAVCSCDGNKASGPDGFNLNFIKANWDVIYEEFLEFLRGFHSDGDIVKELNSTFITLIPKCGRWRKDDVGGLLVKLDFEKAYDCVDHDFMMKEMSFRAKWGLWMRSYISTPMLSVLGNGSPTPQFGLERGLRQGDPLSPFLFNIVTKGLSGLFRKAFDLGLMRRATFGDSSVHISHLQFADDTILFLEPKVEYLRNSMRILRCFELAAGLRINFHKSCVVRVRKTVITDEGWAEVNFFFVKVVGSLLDPGSLSEKIFKGRSKDVLAWSFCSDGRFSVSSFRKSLEDSMCTPNVEHKFIWQGLCPHKIELFAWQLLRGRVMVREVMYRFGFNPSSSLVCSHCNTEDSNTAEIMAIHKACTLCVASRILVGKEIIIVSDSKVAVSWVNCAGVGSLKHVNYIYNIRNCLRILGNTSMVFNPRFSSNAYADALAKKGYGSVRESIIWEGSSVVVLGASFQLCSLFVVHQF
ncbi:hypothetical protein Ddye_017634 [Dipteronia dyeriana]|uniref:Reverse transcriptase domain-containing protein n=1 Tax=Dipteronia dyeriana TaxID=168575 RepID=A0AAD9X1K9_9ROSI|nr:hypothetical protein Ddye_017634 [Dipteronia dyeriana]